MTHRSSTAAAHGTSCAVCFDGESIPLGSGANVDVVLEIRAEMPNGPAEKTIRDVTEICRTLRFDSFGFEEERPSINRRNRR